MQTFSILVLPGDGIGPEVMVEAVKVLNAIQSTSHVKFDIEHALTGGCSIDKHGVAITEEVLEKAQNSDAVLFGAVGGPKWGAGAVRPEEGILALRKTLNCYGNLRPCRLPSESLIHLSVLKSEVVSGTDFLILRENCGGAYFGEKIETADYACDPWGYSRAEVERVARMAAFLAKESHPPSQVISCDKANVLASSRLWRRVVSEVFEKEFPELQLSHQLADSAAMLMMKNPRSFNGIVLMDNTFGDILSDVASVIPGSLGLLPSASLSGVPGVEGLGVKGIYESIHGSAPDIAGKGIANPVAVILSAAMMLKYSFNMPNEAQAIEEAVAKVLDSKSRGGLEIRTGDLGGSATTTQVGDAISEQVREILGK